MDIFKMWSFILRHPLYCDGKRKETISQGKSQYLCQYVRNMAVKTIPHSVERALIVCKFCMFEKF
jgi:hypothetical protein